MVDCFLERHVSDDAVAEVHGSTLNLTIAET